jgi:pyruvyltransferase
MDSLESPFVAPPAPTVKAYWWKGAGRPPNWGDFLTPLLLARFAHVEPRWTERGSADVVCVGSILGHIVGPWYKGTILGTGKLFEAQIVPQRAAVLALRGPLTAKGVPGNYALGDPGLLADELVQIETKKYDLCLIPHWSDKQLGVDERFVRYPHVVVDSAGDPLTIIRTIAESCKVVTSSLHGLILADALMIPRRFEPSAEGVFAGDMFKFRDYNASVGLPFVVGKLQEADSNRVIDRKAGLKDVFKAYGQQVREHRRD